MAIRDEVNRVRYDGGAGGHYESYFQRANHPTRPLAFWIRYTMFVPHGWPGDAVGELWAIYFDGETGKNTAVKEVFPLSGCSFSPRALDVQIGESTLDAEGLSGHARSAAHQLRWSLKYQSPAPPLLLLPQRMYDAPFPKAKALVGSPLARFSGELTVDGQTVPVDRWVGSQNHNWGAKHTDRYAWGQVAGFDEEPEAFFECATARIKLGPVSLPPMTPMVLRYRGEEHRLSSIGRALRASGRYAYFSWYLASRGKSASIEAEIHARAADFVGLRYANPPGGEKTCLNTKLASCKLVLRRKGKSPVLLRTATRAAFEILTDDTRHGIDLLDA